MASSQAQQVADRLPQSSQQRGPNDPQVIIPSALQLDLAREKNLMTLASRRVKELEDELGRLDYSQPNWVSMAMNVSKNGRGVPFFAKRHLAHLIYHLQTDWRAEMLGGIWKETNLHLPLVRRNVMQQIAKAQAYFFGTTPWFNVYAQPWKDDAYAKKVNLWARHEATTSGLDSVLAKAIDLAFIQGEQVTKTIYERNVSYYKTWAEVLHVEGKPFTAKDGDYVFTRDLFVPLPTPVPMEGVALAPPGAPPLTPGLAPPQAPQMVLKRDMRTPMPKGKIEFIRRIIDRKIVHFTGAKTKNVHYMDFLCPLTAESVQSADCVAHIYSEPVINMVNRLLVEEWNSAGLGPKQQLERIKELTSQLMPGNNESDRPAKDSPRPELAESTDMQGRDKVEPAANLAEVWLKADVDGDGIVESVVLLMTKDGR
ncbi:MAG TPA: hypothetical protein VK956_12320, partial [Verrucomicrobium sp.]|nr:hypothetical protein [Verrucomicrobium sp.]